jgi:hypothetical protein
MRFQLLRRRIGRPQVHPRTRRSGLLRVPHRRKPSPLQTPRRSRRVRRLPQTTGYIPHRHAQADARSNSLDRGRPPAATTNRVAAKTVAPCRLFESETPVLERCARVRPIAPGVQNVSTRGQPACFPILPQKKTLHDLLYCVPAANSRFLGNRQTGLIPRFD